MIWEISVETRIYRSVICVVVIQLEGLPSSGALNIEGRLRGDRFNMEDFS